MRVIRKALGNDKYANSDSESEDKIYSAFHHMEMIEHKEWGKIAQVHRTNATTDECACPLRHTNKILISNCIE